MSRFSRVDPRSVALSEYWDDCVAHRGQAEAFPVGVDPELGAVIRDLERLAADAAEPEYATNRGLAALLQQRTAALSVAPIAYPLPAPLPPIRTPAKRFTRVAAFAAAVLLLGLFGIALVARWNDSRDIGPPGIPAPAFVPGATTPPSTPAPGQVALLWQWDFESQMHNIDTYLQVAESPDGKVYVSDDIVNQIHVLDASGTEVDTFGGIGPDPGKFDFGNPSNGWYGGQLGFDAAGNLYVFDSWHQRVQKFGPDNSLITFWDLPEPSGATETPVDDFTVGTVDPANDRVYVATQVHPQVYVYDLEGNLLDTWGMPGRGEGQLTNPSAIAAAPDGTVWIADKSISHIQHFDMDGTYLGSIGERGGGPGQVNQVLGLAVDQHGNIYTAEAGNGRVQILSPDGTSIFAFNTAEGLGRIARPNALWLGSDGTLYVADSLNDRVLKLRLPSLD